MDVLSQETPSRTEADAAYPPANAASGGIDTSVLDDGACVVKVDGQTSSPVREE